MLVFQTFPSIGKGTGSHGGVPAPWQARAAMPTMLTSTEIAARLVDPDADPADIAELLVVDPARSQPMRPFFAIDPRVPVVGNGAPLLIDGISALVRRGRQRRYADRIADGWTGPRLLMDGDSWCQFPTVNDLYRQLDADHAVHCLSGEGSPLHNIVRRKQIGDAIVELRPDAVLLSLGGGDVLDGFRFPAFLERFARGRAPADYPTPYFVAFLQRELIPRLLGLLAACRATDAQVPILLHSYAYPCPRDFIWLGEPLHGLGIADPALQRRVMAALIDRFHTALVRAIAAAGFQRVTLVDCRDAVGVDWFDELHPNNRGFERVAGRFRGVLDTVI